MSVVCNFDYLLKYIIVGDTFVGKSNLLIQYTQKKFDTQHNITIGVEFLAKNITVKGKNLKIQVWDTAGQEAFRSITRSYYKNSACAIIVYDITNRESFKSIETWIKDCKELTPKSVLLVLVGNKVDLAEKYRQVTEEEAIELAEKNEMMFFETSAKIGYNIENLFNSSASEIIDKIESGKIDPIYNNGVKSGRESMVRNSFLNGLIEKPKKLVKNQCC